MKLKDYSSILMITIGWLILYWIVQIFLTNLFRAVFLETPNVVQNILRYSLFFIILTIWITLSKSWSQTKLFNLCIKREDLPFIVGIVGLLLVIFLPHILNKKIDLLQLIYSFGSSFLVALNEEVTWRGLMLSQLEKYGQKTAVFLSSGSFGILHLVNLLFGSTVLIVTFQVLWTSLLAIGLSSLRLRMNTLWIAIIIHCLNNFLSMLTGNRVGYSTALIYSLIIAILGWWSMSGNWKKK